MILGRGSVGKQKRATGRRAGVLLCFLACGAFAPARAAEENLESNLKLVKAAIGETRKVLIDKGKTYHRLNESAAGPQYLWEEANPTLKGRRVLRVYAGLEIRALIKQLEALQGKQDEIEGDLLLLEMQKQEMLAVAAQAATPAKISLANKPFYCATAMADQVGDAKIKIEQPFGDHKDAETGLTWKSSGWWLGNIKHEIKACSTGTVVFSGKIEGRGRVVLLDHGGGLMTLYANLISESALPLSKGNKVAAGTVLGLAPERAYFEVRRNGEALDPKTVVSAKVLDSFVF